MLRWRNLHCLPEWRFERLLVLSRHASCSWRSFPQVSGCPLRCTRALPLEKDSQNCRFCSWGHPKKKTNSSLVTFAEDSTRALAFCSSVCILSTGRTDFFFFDLSIVSLASANAHCNKISMRTPADATISQAHLVYRGGKCFLHYFLDILKRIA